MTKIKKIHSNLCYAGHALLDLDSDKYIVIYSRSQGVFRIVKDGLSPDGYCYRNSGIWDYWTVQDIKDIMMQDSKPDYIINDL
jgi:hypothetical protein